MQTAREKLQSITGSYRNISQIVTLFDTNDEIMREQILAQYDERLPLDKDDWEDTEELLQICSDFKDDLATVRDSLD